MNIRNAALRISAPVACLLTLMLSTWAEPLQRPDPGKKIKVFILAGQSNMEGRADGGKLNTHDLERLRRIQDRVQLAYNYKPVSALQAYTPHPDIAEIYERKTMFGPEIFFGIALAEAWPEEKILLIKRTEGATSLHGWWNPDWSQEKAAAVGEADKLKLYQALTEYVAEILSNYEKDQYEICAMLWVQGETDSSKPAAAAAYGDNLQKLIHTIRKDVGIDTLPFLLFQVGRGKVVEGMQQTEETLPNVTLIPQRPDPDSPDYYAKMENGHYNYEGMKKLGERFAEVTLNVVLQEK